MEREVKTEPKRIDDNFVEVVTTIKEKMSNREFYQYWANLTMKREQMRLSISDGEKQIDSIRKQLEVQIAQIREFEHEAKECEARLKTNPALPLNKL